MADPKSDDAEYTERMIELRLPSRLGYEKVAMNTATSVARLMGFDPDRIEALRTAVSEAVTNAIEHGNERDSTMKVMVMLTARPDELVISVADVTWKRHLEDLSPQMVAKINALLPAGTVRRIEFRVS